MNNKYGKAEWMMMQVAVIMHNEKADCAVKAVSACAQVTYKEAHAQLKLQGREDRRGTPNSMSLAAMRNMGCEVKLHKLPRRMSLKTFVKRHAHEDATYFVHVRGHVVCVRHKEIVDHSTYGSRIIRVWEVNHQLAADSP